MRVLDVRFRQPDWMLHPMQAFIRHEDVVRYEELRTWNLMPDEPIEYELFYVEATDLDRYRKAIESVDSIREYTISPIDEGSCYVYACQETREEDLRFRAAFASLEVVVEPPVIYDRDAAMRMRLVGSSDALSALVENVPEEIDVEVLELGAYDHREGAVAGTLTDRQREAVTAAVDCGFFAVPRTGSVEDVADRLGCAPSTASNHLQKATATLMQRVVDADSHGR